MVRTTNALMASVMMILGGSSSARADSEMLPSYALSWSRGEDARGCIFSQDLARSVEHRLGRRVFTSMADAGFVIEGRIESVPGGFAADVALCGADGSVLGRRHVVANEPDCRALDRSLSLVLALIIDPTVSLASADETPAARPLSSEQPPPTSLPPPSRAETTQAPRSTPAASLLGSEIAAGVAWGKLPFATPGIETAARLVLGGHFIARLGASLWIPQRAGLTGRPEGAWLTLAALTAEGCRSERLMPALALLACAGAEPAVLFSQGSGLDIEHSDRRTVLDVVADGRISVRLGPVTWAALGGRLGVPLVRNEFVAVLADQRKIPVFRSPPVDGSASLGLIFDANP
jgi:hypothetical protein